MRNRCWSSVWHHVAIPKQKEMDSPKWIRMGGLNFQPIWAHGLQLFIHNLLLKSCAVFNCFHMPFPAVNFYRFPNKIPIFSRCLKIYTFLVFQWFPRFPIDSQDPVFHMNSSYPRGPRNRFHLWWCGHFPPQVGPCGVLWPADAALHGECGAPWSS